MTTVKTVTTKTGTTVEAKAKVRQTLPDPRRGLYAYVGAADLAVEKLRTLPEAREQFVARLQHQISDLQAQARELPQALRIRLAELQGKMNETYAEATDKATETYDDLAQRGEKLVTGIRKAPATQQAEARIKTARSQTKATRTSIRKAVDATEAAVESAGHKLV